MASKPGVGQTITRLLMMHRRTAGLSQKAQAALLKVDSSTLSRWKQGTIPEASAQARAAKLLGLSVPDFDRPIEELEHILASAGQSDWTSAEWTISSRFAERWRHDWPSAFDVLSGTHLIYLRIPRRSGEDFISSSLLIVNETIPEKGIRFSLVNIDDSARDGASEIVYTYDGLAFPVADTLFLVGERTDGSEPLAMVLDRPPLRGPLSGYIVAVGAAPGRHYPMSRRIVVVPRSTEILTVAQLRSDLGIFTLDEAPYAARQHTQSLD